MRSSLIAILVLLTGCSGLEIRTLTSGQVEAARADRGVPLDGYVVYEPIVTVEVSVQQTCLGPKDAKGTCTGTTVVQCTASMPFLLPDYTKPYLLSNKNGFGKAGVDVTITDGWRLGAFKDNTDNSAILSTLEKVAGVKSLAGEPSRGGCKAPGLYRLRLNNGNPELVPLALYGA